MPCSHFQCCQRTARPGTGCKPRAASLSANRPWLTTHGALLLPIAVLLTADARAKVGDVGLARFMAADYMSAQAALGTFSWTVREQGYCWARRLRLLLQQQHEDDLKSHQCRGPSSRTIVWATAAAALHVRSSSSNPGTSRWTVEVELLHAQAPEVLMGGKCGSKVDIFRRVLSVWPLMDILMQLQSSKLSPLSSL